MNPVAPNYIALTSIRDIVSTLLTVRPLSTDRFERGERIMLDLPSGKCYVTSGNRGQADDKVDSPSAAVFVIVPLRLMAAHLIAQMVH